MVTFGIPPTRPETGYGYIAVGDPAPGAPPDVLTGEAFVEKPDRDRAEQYVADGRHLWNSGIFVWSAAAFARETGAHVPELVVRMQPVADALGAEEFPAALAAAYADCPAESFDYAVMEHLRAFEVMRARFDWSDLGSWSAWGDLAPELAAGGRGIAEVVSVDSAGNVIHAPGKQVALVGVEDLVIVDTGDALLVCPRRDDQRVKEIIGRLEAAGRDDLI